VAFTF
jgi:hypothetical protein